MNYPSSILLVVLCGLNTLMCTGGRRRCGSGGVHRAVSTRIHGTATQGRDLYNAVAKSLSTASEIHQSPTITDQAKLTQLLQLQGQILSNIQRVRQQKAGHADQLQNLLTQSDLGPRIQRLQARMQATVQTSPVSVTQPNLSAAAACGGETSFVAHNKQHRRSGVSYASVRDIQEQQSKQLIARRNAASHWERQRVEHGSKSESEVTLVRRKLSSCISLGSSSPVHNESRLALLADIRSGIQLRPVREDGDQRSGHQRNKSQLAIALEQMRDRLVPQEDVNENEDDVF